MNDSIEISGKEFISFIDIIKSMKCDVFYYDASQRYIMGTDDSFFVLKSIYLVDDRYSYLMNIAGYTKDLAEFGKKINSFTDTSTIVYNSYGIFVIKGDYISDLDTVEYSSLDICLNPELYFREVGKIYGLYSKVKNITMTNQDTCFIPDLKSNERFKEILQLKSDEGIKTFIVNDKYIMTLYNNLLPINQADKVDLMIYDIYDDYRSKSFMVNFIITKKKKIVINVYLKFLHLK